MSERFANVLVSPVKRVTLLAEFPRGCFPCLPTNTKKLRSMEAKSLVLCQRAETPDNSDRFAESVIGSRGHN